MSFPCSLFKFLSKSHKLNCYLVDLKRFCVFSNKINGEKYWLKKTVRQFQKVMLVKYDPNLISPPEAIRGLKILDKSLFQKVIQVSIIELNNTFVSKIMHVLKKYLLKMEKLKAVQTNNETNFVILNPLYVKLWTDIEESDRNELITLGISEENFKTINYSLNFDNWKADDLLKSILPKDKQSVTSFSKIGHIVHLNLKDHVLDYKNIIGSILLEKIPGTRSVVNKLDKIDTTYRNFEMEILCGDSDTLVRVKENQCVFDFDFATVYWNPRLATEHERIIKMLKPFDVLYDVFAGVGPFSIPAAKKKCFVLANDLNPESFKWLNSNSKANKINNLYLKTFNKDGRDFILNDLQTDLKNRFESNFTGNIYITMNLPALAPEFLPCFINLFSKSELSNKSIECYPTVIVYCFAKGENTIEIARDLIESNLGCSLPENHEIFSVRKVSNNKEMMRVSFRLNCDILCKNCKREAEDDLSTPIKKCV